MSGKPISLIVNADDLGISESVNDAIFDYYDRGLITSATLIVNGPAVSHAIDEASSRPGLGIGVHLNTSEFQPMSDRFTEVRDRQPDLDLRTARVLSRSVVSAVADEWRLQMIRARELGVEASHLDSHHFDHVNPVLLPALITLARSTGVRRVRGMYNVWAAPKSAPVRLAKATQRHLYRLGGLRTTDVMCDADTFLSCVGSSSIPAGCSVEVMTHPGHPSYETENHRIETEFSEMADLHMISWNEL